MTFADITVPPADEPIREDDEFIAAALQSASIPALMMSLVHVSGDTGLLDGSIRPRKAVLGEMQGGLSDDQRAEVRRLALRVLGEYRDRGCTLPPPVPPATIRRMMSFAVGEQVPDEYGPMMMEEMALDGRDARWDGWRAVREKIEGRDFRVLVIGAGMSGILAAIRLEQAGVPYSVVEKNDGVGGTWRENTYPGCRVDIANHFYCYSFEPNHEWSEFFCRQEELRRYFEACVDKYGVREKIRFRTEVVAASFDETSSRWRVTLRNHRGVEKEVPANVLISAVGQLNRAKIPDIRGRRDFAGPSFHSAEWEHGVSLAGKRVAVIGTGASALQLVPEVAEEAGHLYVLQRSPAWMFPNPAYHRKVSDRARWLFKHVPYYARWYRFMIFWPGSDGLLPSLIVDRDWPHQDRSINELNEQTRIIFSDYIEQQVGDDPDLLAKTVPSYPPFGKRMLQDNGGWLATLKRDDVDLVCDPIDHIEADAIVCEGGRRLEVDVIVFATGFHANRFLWPMKITGRGGAVLNEVWGEEPRAYLGITVPDFPNLYCLYGPSTNLAHAGSIIFHSECQVRYIVGCIKAMVDGGIEAVECRREVHDEYNDRLDEALAQTVWAHPGVDSWYKNAAGRVTTTSPWRLVDYWAWTKEPDLADFTIR